MKLISRPSPNFDERNAQIDMIILHYTGMKTTIEAVERLCDPVAKVSAHYVLDENGDVYQLVDESKRAWHAGISYWRGKSGLNANSVGIEIVNPGHEFGYRHFTTAQYASLIKLCSGIQMRYDVASENIIGHSDIAPERKKDPGELFDWKLLAENGLGLWPGKQSSPRLQNAGTVKDTDLRQIGYEKHDEHSVTAFQRHWRQNLVNGVWDDKCVLILSSLLKT